MNNENSSIEELYHRTRKLEETVVLLADFSMMTTLWLFRLTSDEITSLTREWFTTQLNRMFAAWPDSERDPRTHAAR